ncbi:MAG: MarR family transcriptional regulator [Rhodoglobus sp.]|nr:MarR family transcriptional regulator [Rhodoglobus sp.]
MATAIEDLARLFVRIPTAQKLSLSTAGALKTLSRRSPMRLADLTASEQVTQPAMTQIVSRLERDGMVERHKDPDDGRAVLVHITDVGIKVIASRQSDRLDQLTRLFERLTEDERTSITSALPALMRVIELGSDS